MNVLEKWCFSQIDWSRINARESRQSEGGTAETQLFLDKPLFTNVDYTYHLALVKLNIFWSR
jgi:hypothetical protein